MLSALQVYIDPPSNLISSLPYDDVMEFSRNERGRQILRLNVIPSTNDASIAGEEITIRLMKARRERLEEVKQARKTFTFTGPVPLGGQVFEWDLRNVYYDSTSNRWPIIRRGEYFFQVEHTGGPSFPTGISETTKDFVVTLLTTDKMEAEWLAGTTRRSNDDRFVRYQPRELTGVVVTEVNKNYPLDHYDLALVFNSHNQPNLVWSGGKLTPVDVRLPDGIQKKYILTNAEANQYIEVAVDPRLLPNVNTTERLFIDRMLIDRDTIRRAINEEIDFMENEWLHMPLEPSLCVSDYTLSNLSPSNAPELGAIAENFDYDFKGPPLTYYPPTAGHWIDIDVPFARPLKWDYLVGAFEITRVIDIPTKWIHNSFARRIQLVPYNQTSVFSVKGLGLMGAMRGARELPSFWRYRYWAGLHHEMTPSDILDILKMRSAEKVLSILGQMFRGGFSSESISRDGVSESVTYTASAMYGIYSATIADIREMLKRKEQAVQRKYFGLSLVVV